MPFNAKMSVTRHSSKKITKVPLQVFESSAFLSPLVHNMSTDVNEGATMGDAAHATLGCALLMVSLLFACFFKNGTSISQAPSVSPP